MRYPCNSCSKSVTSEMPDDVVIRAMLTCPECIEANRVVIPEPVANDEDIVLRFRNLLAQVVVALPLQEFRDEKERRSTAVTMMLRATIQELIAHLGAHANHKSLTFVLGSELRRALDAAREEAENPVTKN